MFLQDAITENDLPRLNIKDFLKDLVMGKSPLG